VLKEYRADPIVTSFVVAHLDGILEDNRTRASKFLQVQNDYKARLDLYGILNSFLITAQDPT
jgi:hypothetical protein